MWLKRCRKFYKNHPTTLGNTPLIMSDWSKQIRSLFWKLAFSKIADVENSTFHRLVQTFDSQYSESFLNFAQIFEFCQFRNDWYYSKWFHSTALCRSKIHIFRTKASSNLIIPASIENIWLKRRRKFYENHPQARENIALILSVWSKQIRSQF